MTVACDSGYVPTGAGPTAAACSSSNPYTLSGCVCDACTCEAPPAEGTTGYGTITETTLSSRGFNVTVDGCADHYEGTPVATACAVNGPYTLSGCNPIECTRPSDITGYDVTETQLDTSQVFDVSVQCAEGYTELVGGATATACTTSGEYSLSGCNCDACTCVRPADTTGYGTITETNLNSGEFSVTVSNCARNYAGNPVATACTVDGYYTLSGCSPVLCTQPDTPGYVVVENQLDLTLGDFDVEVVCGSGYLQDGTGPTATACTAPGV